MSKQDYNFKIVSVYGDENTDIMDELLDNFKEGMPVGVEYHGSSVVDKGNGPEFEYKFGVWYV